MCTRDLSLKVKRPKSEADHSPPSSAEIKNAWSYTSIPQYVFMAWCLVKHRDNFTFNFYFRNLICKIKGEVSLYPSITKWSGGEAPFRTQMESVKVMQVPAPSNHAMKASGVEVKLHAFLTSGVS
jgi:hypothetical protein